MPTLPRVISRRDRETSKVPLPNSRSGDRYDASYFIDLYMKVNSLKALQGVEDRFGRAGFDLEAWRARRGDTLGGLVPAVHFIFADELVVH